MNQENSVMIPSEIAHLKKGPKQEESPPDSAFKKILSKKRNEESNPNILSPYLTCSYEAPILVEGNKATSEVNSVTDKYCVYLDELADAISMKLILQDEISTLKTTYQKEGSPFNNLEIFIDHYSTAPSSFNIELYGQPSAVDILANSYPQLIERLSLTLPGHQFNISSPFIKSDRQTKEKKRESALKKSLKI
jgi:hypothetical protein